MGLMFPSKRLSPGITGKLFLAVLFTAVCVVVAMALAAQWSFSRGFLGYLNELEAQRLQATRPRIEAAYVENGRNWEFLRSDRRQWFHLLRPQPDPDSQSADPPVPSQTGPSFPARTELTGALLRTSLYDADGNYVVGLTDVRIETQRWPLVVDGATVGWVATAPFQSVTASGDVRFERSQYRATWTMGAVSVLLAALVALWVARVLLHPLRQMARATHRLAEGDYAIRVKVQSRDEVGQLAEDFNRMAGALERTEKKRRDFMADLSHELRTPLGVLNGELEAIEDGLRPLTRESLHSLQAEVTTLNKLVSDLYDLSLADAGAMTFLHTPLDWVELLRATTQSYQARFAEAGLGLQFECQPADFEIAGDARRLRQLLSNLLENALRYTDPGGLLRMRLRRNGGMAELQLDDSPPGIAPEHLTRIFDRFYRVEGSRSRASGGAGLGLAICQRIVQAHGGTLVASASDLGGLRLVVQLPLRNEETPDWAEKTGL